MYRFFFKASTPAAAVSNYTGGLPSSEPSYPKEVAGPSSRVPSRAQQILNLRSHSVKDNPYDILVIGGGATGTGCALDAVTRGEGGSSLSVACIERGDFASETSSRSTKLVWAGIKYLATAAASLLSKNLITNPIDTVSDFTSEFKMVFNCHRERKYMLEKQGHLCNWIPIAIPFTSWYVTPAPFGHPLFCFFPILAPFVFIFYDGLSGFSCPSSYVMGKKKAKAEFPMLANRDIKYCAVFYEAQHNDARTCVAIAMTAAEHGATMANYVEMIGVLYDEESKKAVGIRAKDKMSGEEFLIYAKKIVFSGGPYTDGLRKLENEDASKLKDGEEKPFRQAVRAASGTHIVLPSYYSPNQMGLLDYNTSDKRFLFFLPWQNHTLVGTTDMKGPAQTLPEPPEDQIQWLLKECSTYLSKDLHVRRSDVLSSWRGWRPLATTDPNSDVVSRDHVIHENPETGIVYVAGGKWVTWREMAQDTIDKVVDSAKMKCRTLDITLWGGNEGYASNLSIQLIQKYELSKETAEHLVRTYGGQAWEVCELAEPTGKTYPRFGVQLVPDYPYIDAEVKYACREYACTIEDVLSRRTRLAFLNKDAAISAVPKVADIMAKELGWSEKVKQQQISSTMHYLEAFGGRIPDEHASELRSATYSDVTDVFNAIDANKSGDLDIKEVGDVATSLGFKMTDAQLKEAFVKMDKNNNGRITLDEFVEWWNNDSDNSHFRKKLTDELGVGGNAPGDLKEMGSGTMFG